jgi:adenylosuccinate lyase
VLRQALTGEEKTLIERYTRAAMGRIWTEQNKYRCWLQVERRRARCWPRTG